MVNELDDHLGEPVGRRGFAGEKERTWVQVEPRVLAQSVVEHNDPQCIQELAFVLVDAFDLAIEDRLRIKGLPCRPVEPNTELSLGISLDLKEVITEAIVFSECFELA